MDNEISALQLKNTVQFKDYASMNESLTVATEIPTDNENCSQNAAVNMNGTALGCSNAPMTEMEN